jgi:Raf kinase inhibitor-like YbhB/YbcL family protein
MASEAATETGAEAVCTRSVDSRRDDALRQPLGNHPCSNDTSLGHSGTNSELSGWIATEYGTQMAMPTTLPRAALGSVLFAASILGQAKGGMMPFQIASSAFSNGETIPKKFTCDGTDLSPPLSWKERPAATQSFALIADDPDAPVGVWVHWVLYNVPANMTELPEGVEKQERLASGATEGRNDFRRIGYGGPCPPPGKPHRYYFKLYALDTKLALKAGATKAELEDAMKGHILGETEIMGRYGR